MGWNLNKSLSLIQGLLGERFDSFHCTPDSSSSIVIVHNAEITENEEDKITNCFPDWIRVEFVQVGGKNNK